MKRSGSVLVASLLALLLISAIHAGSVAAHEGHDVLKFGVFPYKSPRTIVKLFAPIAKRLEQALGIEVQLVTAPDYKTYVARGKAGAYDISFPCVSCYYQIKEAGYTVIARGEPSFYGGVVVRKDSGIDNVSQLKGKKIAAIGLHSYAGYSFLPQQLHTLGIDPQEEVEFQFLGKLDSIIFGVINRKYDAGTVRRDAMASPAFKAVFDDLKFIAQSEPIPQFPFVVKKDMPPARVEIIRKVLVALNPADEADRQILKSLLLQAVRPANDADYEPFRQVLQQAQEFSSR